VHGAVVPREDVTPYARLGDAFAWACALATAVVMVVIRSSNDEA
jgi:apolipoprotein N-acyltransferase